MNRDLFDYSTIIVKFIFIILTAAFVAFVAYGIYLLIIPFAIALLLALTFSPIINYLERFNIPRLVIVLILMPLVLLLVYGLASVLTPLMEIEYHKIESNISIYEVHLKKVLGSALFKIHDALSGYFKLAETDLPSLLEDVISGVKAKSKNIGEGIVAGLPTVLTYLLITPIIAFVFLIQGNTITHNLLGMVPNRYFEMTLLLVKKIRDQITSYLKGLIIQWGILSIIMSIGLTLIGLPYGIIIGMVAASVNIVPYLGPLVGLVPALLVAIIVPGNGMVASTLMVIGLAQLVDNMFTQPVILARSAQVHPIISILAVITAISLDSMLLIIVAIPLAGILMLTIEVMYRSLKAFRMI